MVQFSLIVCVILLLFKSKVIDNSDVVIEVLDARDPLGCRCLEVEKTILESGPNKKLILLLNKIGELSSKIC